MRLVKRSAPRSAGACGGVVVWVAMVLSPGLGEEISVDFVSSFDRDKAASAILSANRRKPFSRIILGGWRLDLDTKAAKRCDERTQGGFVDWEFAGFSFVSSKNAIGDSFGVGLRALVETQRRELGRRLFEPVSAGFQVGVIVVGLVAASPEDFHQAIFAKQ